MAETIYPKVDTSVAVYSSSATMTIEDAKKVLRTFSSVSEFEDDQWVIDKTNKDQNIQDSDRKITFTRINNSNNATVIKLFTLMRLMKRYSIRGITGDVNRIREFLRLLPDTSIDLSEITPKDVFNYYVYLFEGNQTTTIKRRLEKWHFIKEFFKTMNYQSQYQLFEKYTTELYPDKRRVDAKLIPEDIAQKMDVEFLKEDVPLVFRTIYWLLRLIPNRITEVLSMKMNCLKQINDEYYMISIPTFKQSGPYSTGGIKLIEVKYTGTGQYLINLLQQFVDERKKQTNSADEDFLFYSPRVYLLKNKDFTFRYSIGTGESTILSVDRVAYFLEKFCTEHDITMEDGTPYSVTTHQFRHNATSDRINSGIFRSIDVQGLTYHHSTAMIEQTYTHQDKGALTDNAPVVFKGRIINTDNERKLNQLLSKPYAKNIYKLGICSDVRVCNKEKSACLRCDYMIPDVDDLDYYVHELNDWISKRDKAKLTGNSIFMELCEDWINSYQIVIAKVLSAITNENTQNMEVSYGEHKQDKQEHAENVRGEAPAYPLPDSRRN